MASKSSGKMFGKCRCCLKNGQHKDILSTYYRNGDREVYRDMILDCFNIFLSTSPNITTLICSKCIKRLIEALEFKTLVLESEQRLLADIGSQDTLFINVPEASLHSDVEIKIEEVKEELQDYDMDSGIPDDNEVAVCDTDLTEKCTSETADSDLLEGEAALLARFKNHIRPLPTRASLCSILPTFARHLESLKGQIVLPSSIEKLVENTKTENAINTELSEKNALVTNSAMLLENSNMTPFKSRNKAGLPCYYCRSTFENLESLREHQAKTHKKTEIKKLLRAYGAESLIVYVDVTNLKCSICNENMSNINNLKSHLIKIHKKTFYEGFTDRVIPFKLSEDNIFVCQICGFSLETFGSIERHMNTHYRNYICKECGTGFATKYRLKVHTKSMHIGGTFPCEQCKKIFKSQQKLKNHIDFVHKSYKRFKCAKCPERFSEYFKRQKHMVDKHGVAPLKYKCNVCDKTFDRRYTLSRHLKRDHLEERDFQCEMCSYKCFTNNELRVHMIKHNGERIYECSVCKKSYARKKTLKEHLRIHNNDRRFACAVCGQAFVQKCSLKGHMKTHHIEFNPGLL